MEATDDRDKANVETGSQIISFDQQYDYQWLLLQRDERCTALNEKRYGKVCHWREAPNDSVL